tara:strand:+ start:246 stop:461 length:216 start_codon:yes stop_codon:yes gene_type:complete
MSQAISDAYLDDPKPKEEVIEWLESDDFEVVCDHAAINAERMKAHFYDILSAKPALARYKGRKLKDVIVNY